MPPQVKSNLQDRVAIESSQPETASLFGGDEKLSPHERRIYKLLRADVATQIDQIIEQLEPEVSSSEIFAALFELELSGKVKQMPGKNFVRSF
jgi:DNA processing protein